MLAIRSENDADSGGAHIEMASIYFSESHKSLVEKLCNEPLTPDGRSIFPAYRDLMLFAAMVGRRYERVASRTGNGGEVETAYFSSGGFNKDGVVYLLGLVDLGGPEIFRDGAKDCWRLFESYLNGGMEIIAEWLTGAEEPKSYWEVLLNRTLEMARGEKKVPVIIKKPKMLPVQ